MAHPKPLFALRFSFGSALTSSGSCTVDQARRDYAQIGRVLGELLAYGVISEIGVSPGIEFSGDPGIGLEESPVAIPGRINIGLAAVRETDTQLIKTILALSP